MATLISYNNVTPSGLCMFWVINAIPAIWETIYKTKKQANCSACFLKIIVIQPSFNGAVSSLIN